MKKITIFLFIFILFIFVSCKKSEKVIGVIDFSLIKKSQFYKNIEKQEKDYKNKLDKKLKAMLKDKTWSEEDIFQMQMVFEQDFNDFKNKLEHKFFLRIYNIVNYIAYKNKFNVVLLKDVMPVGGKDITKEVLNLLKNKKIIKTHYNAKTNMKIAYIDLEKIYNSNYYKLYNKNIQTYFNTLKKELSLKLNKVKTFKEKEKLMDTYNKEFLKYKNDMKEKFDKHLKEVIKKYAKFTGFKIILLKNDIFFGGDDITEDIIKELEK